MCEINFHPLVGFIFFLGAIIFAMFFMHPLYLIISLLSSLILLLLLEGRGAVRTMAGMGLLFMLVSLVNPFINSRGESILFTYMGGRAFTLEAFCCGMAMAAMFVTALFWFICLGQVMGSDKVIYLFSGAFPLVSLLVSMVFRMLPSLKRRGRHIAAARACVGVKEYSGDLKARMGEASAILGTMVSGALEDGIVTADSMRSRAYGSGRRSSFRIYTLKAGDILTIFILLVLITAVVFCSIRGGAGVSYFPRIYMAGTDNRYFIPGAAAYGIFSILPSFIILKEAAGWHL